MNKLIGAQKYHAPLGGGKALFFTLFHVNNAHCGYFHAFQTIVIFGEKLFLDVCF